MSLKKYFDEYSKDNVSDINNTFFDKIAKATLVKAFEFNLFITSEINENIFYMLPMLRGICEEFIVEKFIFELFPIIKERNSIVQLRCDYDRIKSSIAQWEYFSQNKPNQILYYENTFPIDLEKVKKTIKDKFKQKIVPTPKLNPFPSIYFMADKTGLKELYDYLYHATSTFVHFNPYNLGRMGWGELPNIQFSAKNFVRYYNEFAIFYSASLFCKLCHLGNENGYLSDFNIEDIKPIEEILDNLNRRPELVTFEEMNISQFSRLFYYKSPDMVANNI